MSARLTDRRGLTALILAVGLAALSVVLIRTAWVSDDAFISFRTADNVVHGHGLRWNVDERVQAYTHPLWLGLFTAVYFVTGEPYYTAIALGFLLTLVGVWVTAGRLAATPWNALAYLSLLYITWVGGDFMIGRFYTPLFVWAATLVAAAPWPRGVGLAVASAALVLGLLAPDEPALLSGYNSASELREEPGSKQRRWWLGEAFDERRVYYMDTGLLKQRAGPPTPAHEGALTGPKWRRAGVTTVTFPTIGFAGYFAGPGVHIIDPYALSDPVLARLPAMRKFRVGHYERQMPEGYPETVASGVNRISDPGLAAYYDRMRLIVSGPLWTRARWRAIADELTGKGREPLRHYVATLPFPAHY